MNTIHQCKINFIKLITMNNRQDNNKEYIINEILDDYYKNDILDKGINKAIKVLTEYAILFDNYNKNQIIHFLNKYVKPTIFAEIQYALYEQRITAQKQKDQIERDNQLHINEPNKNTWKTKTINPKLNIK
jgi:hypothetical protein